jgi:hypothetical protein
VANKDECFQIAAYFERMLQQHMMKCNTQLTSP